jgi:mono/diheme cytochrome c family protein
MMSTFIKLLAIAVVGVTIFASATADPRTINDGVYTKEQAKVGEALYSQHCILCHDKKYFRPVLNRWEGQDQRSIYRNEHVDAGEQSRLSV